MTKFIIRAATPQDIPAMMELETQRAAAAHWNRRDYNQLFTPGAPKRIAFLIEEAGQAQGFLIARTVGWEWEIENVVVACRAQRRGLGSRLVAQFLHQARQQGAHSVFLEVRESNCAARRLYKKWAFVESGRRKGYYRDPAEDAIVYQLSLTATFLVHFW